MLVIRGWVIFNVFCNVIVQLKTINIPVTFRKLIMYRIWHVWATFRMSFMIRGQFCELWAIMYGEMVCISQRD